uniref:Uncharacterized protein n=1 Tax=Helianthus annuus TaxID=4232 RepID=A0A251TWS6_HELAN
MLWLEDYLIWVLQYCDDATLRHYMHEPLGQNVTPQSHNTRRKYRGVTLQIAHNNWVMVLRRWHKQRKLNTLTQ